MSSDTKEPSEKAQLIRNDLPPQYEDPTHDEASASAPVVVASPVPETYPGPGIEHYKADSAPRVASPHPIQAQPMPGHIQVVSGQPMAVVVSHDPNKFHYAAVPMGHPVAHADQDAGLGSISAIDILMNFLWAFFGLGIPYFMLYIVIALSLALSIIFIPLAIELFSFAIYTLVPYGRTANFAQECSCKQCLLTVRPRAIIFWHAHLFLGILGAVRLLHVCAAHRRGVPAVPLARLYSVWHHAL